MTLVELSDTAGLSRKARDLIDSGRVVAARSLVAALRRVAPEGVALCELEARLLAREGRNQEALDCLDAGQARFVDACLPILAAELRLQAGDVAGAARDAATAVVADPSNPHAKGVLGFALGQLGMLADAEACLAEAVATGPLYPSFRQALAEVQERSGNCVAAADTLARALADWPGNLPLRVAAIMVAMRQRAFVRAVELCEEGRRAGVADACIFGLLGHARSSLGEHVAAGEAYEEARKLAPEDPYVRHLAATSGIVAAGGRAPRDYVETVFDGYADRFESHLIDLGYRVPGVIRAVLQGLRGRRPLGDVLDLGCGTGFMGVVLWDLGVRRLVGVDLSARMLAQAGRKGIYAELRHEDVEDTLSADGEAWDVIVAADVLTYFGDIGALLAGMHARLRPGGLALFSLEEAVDGLAGAAGSWALQRQGRYVHSGAYLRAAAEGAGLRVVEIRRETLRHEAGAPVDGLVAVLERPLA